MGLGPDPKPYETIWNLTLPNNKDKTPFFKSKDNHTFIEVGRQVHEAHFRQTEVSQLDMPQRGYKQIVGLEIAVNDAVALQVLNGFGSGPITKTQTQNPSFFWV